MYRDRFEKVCDKVTTNGEELYNYKGMLRNYEKIKQMFIGNFANGFIEEFEKLIQ